MMSEGLRPDPTNRPPLPGAGSVAALSPDAPAEVDVAQLVLDHHADVYRYAYRLAGAAADAEDLTQQTFLLAQSHRSQLRDPALARRWLFSILRHEFLRTRRKHLPTPSGMLADVCDDDPADGAIDGPIDQEALQQALDELPDEFKLVLLEFYFEDRSYREIAEELELPIGTVMSRLSRAKRHLRGKLLERSAADDATPPAANGSARNRAAMAASGAARANRPQTDHGMTSHGKTESRNDSVTERPRRKAGEP
ncbi:MAG: RNA polymerase sigma factor [Pirellulales bacterium]